MWADLSPAVTVPFVTSPQLIGGKGTHRPTMNSSEKRSSHKRNPLIPAKTQGLCPDAPYELPIAPLQLLAVNKSYGNSLYSGYVDTPSQRI